MRSIIESFYDSMNVQYLRELVAALLNTCPAVMLFLVRLGHTAAWSILVVATMTPKKIRAKGGKARET